MNTTTEIKSLEPTDIVSRLRSLLGEDVVLLPITAGQKCPSLKNWQDTSLEQMSDQRYLQRLRTGNIGVLLGEPSSGLCSIDIDDDASVDEFLNLNPKLMGALRTKGARGCNVWVRIKGAYPKLTRLEHETAGADGTTPKAWGEWRSTGGQTVIFGKHPNGGQYQILHEGKPVELEFREIVWPDYLNLPWDYGLYDDLVQQHGPPYRWSKGEIKLNELFFVAKFAEEHVLVHEPNERQFYSYQEERGLWLPETFDVLKHRVANDLKGYANSQQAPQIEILRTNSRLSSLSDLLRGKTEKQNVFGTKQPVIHVKNGMLHLDTTIPELREFSPSYYSRNQCPIPLIDGADCPRFKNEFLTRSLDPDDISLLQRWCGAVLLGGNRAQKILLLIGKSGGGKSTVTEVVELIIGLENVAELRTEHLAERFELSRYLRKKLLTGKDVEAEFLMRKGASNLKKMVGHDFLSAEAKNNNQLLNTRGEFDIVITANTRLRVKLEGDVEAWRRRLLLIEFKNPPVSKPINNFASMLVQEEGTGILLWMVEGAIEHLQELNATGGFTLSEEQKARVDTLLAESDSVREFVRTRLKPSLSPGHDITVEELVQGYATFCTSRNWYAVAPATVQKQLPELIATMHQIHQRHDIKRDGLAQRGFKDLECDTTNI
jgi:P4 family phage/plasmid primase-like protien